MDWGEMRQRGMRRTRKAVAEGHFLALTLRCYRHFKELEAQRGTDPLVCTGNASIALGGRKEQEMQERDKKGAAHEGPEQEDLVDDASADSFPASDPPSFTPTSGSGRREPAYEGEAAESEQRDRERTAAGTPADAGERS